MIHFETVSKKFEDGTLAVDKLDLNVAAGELTVLVGPSGCGKTTTLQMINRLDEPTSGRISVDGRDIMATDRIELRRGIGYAMQHSGLFPHRTTRDNIATVPRLLGWEKARVAQRVDELVELVGLLPEIMDRYPHQLSGGQQQRVGLARALAADPPILLMDEPFAAVDPIVRNRLQDEFLDLQRRVGKTIVFVTHDIDEAIKIGDRIAVFRDGGQLAQFDRPTDLLAEPIDDFVSDFLGPERELKRLALIPVSVLETVEGPAVRTTDSIDHAHAVARHNNTDWVVVLDEQNAMLGWLDMDTLADVGSIKDCSPHSFRREVSANDSLRAALNGMVANETGVVPRLGQQRRYEGLLTHARLRRHLS